MNPIRVSLLSVVGALVLVGCGKSVSSGSALTLDLSRLENNVAIRALADETQQVKKDVQLELTSVDTVFKATLVYAAHAKLVKEGKLKEEDLAPFKALVQGALEAVEKVARPQLKSKGVDEKSLVRGAVGLDGFLLVYGNVTASGEVEPVAAVGVQYVLKDGALTDYSAIIKTKND